MDEAGSDEGRKRQRLLESANDSSTTAPATKKNRTETLVVSIHQAAANLSSGLSKLRSETEKEMMANLLSTIPKTTAQQDDFVAKQARMEATIDTLKSLARSARDLAQSNREKEREREQREQDLKERINVLASKLVCAEKALETSNQRIIRKKESLRDKRWLKNLANATKEGENLEPSSNETAPEVEVLTGEKEGSADDVHTYKHTYKHMDMDNTSDSSPGEYLSTGNAAGDDERESHENSSPLHSCRL